MNDKTQIVYAEYIKSDEWKDRRVLALKRATTRERYSTSPRCEFCGQAGSRFKKRRSDLDHRERKHRVDDSNGLEVHHLHYRTLGEELPEDLVVLCTDNLYARRKIGCHERAHLDPLFRDAVERLVERRERGGIGQMYERQG